ncbi:MAG: tetratricopeptide repeat protein [Candidatus Marinimicrobia bacterium]|nr:tetratricopeptide repeat protein [Candidatus Neomarinimicrobiota bacterium]MDD5582736.1 tetratricopeptide repeat protein [Candidatus Neomarinimicrobiota bacterium]
MRKILPLLMLLLLFAASCDHRSPEQILEDAEVNLTQNKFDEAVKDYETFVKKYPDHPKAAETSYRIAEIHMNRRQNIDDAIKAFLNTADGYEKTEYGAKAKFMAGFLLANNTDRLDEAKKVYEDFLDTYPDHELRMAVTFEIENLGKPLESIPQLKTILNENNPEKPIILQNATEK